jgi:hypothetical protein
MALPTRASIREAAEAHTTNRPLLSGTFWLDTFERVASSAAGGALAVVTLDGFNLIAGDTWQAIAIGAGTAALTSLLKAITATKVGTGSASLVPGV